MLLETPRLRLRRFVLEDAPFILALLNSAGWLRYIGDRGVRTVEDARGYLERASTSYARHGFGLYHVAQKSDGAAVGTCGLLKRDYLDDVDIGFAFLPQFTGRGYASEACARVMAHAREDLGCRRLAAIVQADNGASQRVLAKLGLSDVGPVQLPTGETLRLYRRELAG
jgi:ribosomal-protein-alanine N-acetyltransferase